MRLQGLKKRFMKDENVFKDYSNFMEDFFQKGYAERSPNASGSNKWYIPHHGVCLPAKVGKIRVVFDCSAEYLGYALNKQFIPGPDLIDQLVGILIRFKEEQVAIMGDIEATFHQARIPKCQRSMLRFLWWEGNNFNKQPTDHQMYVHVFGGASSPSCCNYALKRAAINNEVKFGAEAAKTLMRNFYVDDLLKSTPDAQSPISLIKAVTKMCKAGGFKFGKFISNDTVVLKSLQEDQRRKGVKDADLSSGELPVKRTLGDQWNIDKDKFGFKLAAEEKTLTCRGLLSTLSSVYDPLGFAAPFILEGRIIIQKLCKENSAWDESIPRMLKGEWNIWKEELRNLVATKVLRCFKPTAFSKIKDPSVHYFSDASETGYGKASYLRLVSEDNQIHCSLLIGKSRVTPAKYVSIPRLEMTAATLSIKMSQLIKRELELNDVTSIRSTSGQIAKLSLLISTMKAKGSKCLWQTECS